MKQAVMLVDATDGKLEIRIQSLHAEPTGDDKALASTILSALAASPSFPKISKVVTPKAQD